MHFDRLLFIQPGLKKTSGHWLMETREWHRAVQAHHMRWFAAAHHTFDVALATRYDIKPVFPFRPFDHIHAPAHLAELANLIEMSDVFNNVAKLHFPADISATDLLFLPFCTGVEIFGVAKWLDTIPPEKRPAVAFMFHRPDKKWNIDVSVPTLGGNFSSWQYAVRAIFFRLPPQRVRFFSTSDILSKTLEKMYRMPTGILPVAFPLPDKNPPALRDKSYDVCVFGGERGEQGEDKWADIFRSLDARRPGVTASVRILLPEQEPALRSALVTCMPAPQLDICTGALSQEEYYRRMVDSRVLLLPYLPAHYCYMQSGVFIEAACRGIPTVVPESTTMARYIQSGQAAGVVYKNDDPASIAAAVDQALGTIETLNQRALSLAETWKRNHDANHVLELLLDAFAS